MEWISVKDRLPDKEGRYLCVCNGYIEVLDYSKNLYKVDKYRFYEKKEKDGFYSYDGEWGYYDVDDITHWMPLPEFPKGE